MLIDPITATVIIVGISAIASIIGSLIAAVVAIKTGRKVEGIKQDVADVKQNTNGLTEKLIRESSANAYQKGMTQGLAAKSMIDTKNFDLRTPDQE